MKKRKKRILIITFSLVVISLSIFIKEVIFSEKEKENINISVITKGGEEESFIRLKSGLDRAKDEMNVNIKFINLDVKNNKEEQLEILKEEINKDVDAILITPVEYIYIKEEIDKHKKKTPIIILEAKVEDSKIVNIPYDNYKIGYKIADEIMSRGNFNKNILVLEEEYNDCYNERKNGFLDSINLTKNKVKFLKVNNKKEIIKNVEEIFKENKEDIIVSFDLEILEEVAKIKERYLKKSEVQIYGIGTTDYIIAAVEKGIINGFSIQSDFNMGYLGVKAAVDLIGKGDFKNIVIDSKIINYENMYYDYNQKILFPFVN